MGLRDFISWQEAQNRFGLRGEEEEGWKCITQTVRNKWHDILEKDWETTRHGSWLGLFVEGLSDPVLVCKNGRLFDPRCMEKIRVNLPIQTQCFRVGPQSKSIQEWLNPSGEYEGFFHEVRISKTTRGHSRHEVLFYYGKKACLKWDPNRWIWKDKTRFLDYSSKMGRSLLGLPSNLTNTRHK